MPIVLVKTPIEIIKEVFGQEEPFVSIATCESGLKQFEPDGSVRHGKKHPPDTGIFQINMSVHSELAKEKGLDVNTLEGNIQMAKVIYDSQGLGAWKSSDSCHHALDELATKK